MGLWGALATHTPPSLGPLCPLAKREKKRFAALGWGQPRLEPWSEYLRALGPAPHEVQGGGLRDVEGVGRCDQGSDQDPMPPLNTDLRNCSPKQGLGMKRRESGKRPECDCSEEPGYSYHLGEGPARRGATGTGCLSFSSLGLPT
jgi:hypothetical protein